MKSLNFLAKPKVLVVLAILNVVLLCGIAYFKQNFEILDTKFFYLKSEIQPLLLSLGDDGRAAYLNVNVVDFGFIAMYTLFFYGVYIAFFKEVAASLLVIPSLLCLADTVETSAIFYLLKTFPETHNNLEYLLMFTTPVKWLLALSTLLVIVNGYFVNLYIKKT